MADCFCLTLTLSVHVMTKFFTCMLTLLQILGLPSASVGNFYTERIIGEGL